MYLHNVKANKISTWSKVGLWLKLARPQAFFFSGTHVRVAVGTKN